MGRFSKWFRQGADDDEASVVRDQLVLLKSEFAELGKRRVALKKAGRISDSVPPIRAVSLSGAPREDSSINMPEVGQGTAEIAGLALSGGGLRSASVCLGALQALNRMGVLDRMDYLSTVSGGGYAGGSYVASSHEQKKFCFDRQKGLPDKAKPLQISDTRTMRHLRDYSNFLTPNGFVDLLQDIALIVRGLVTSAFIIAPYVMLLAAFTLVYYAIARSDWVAKQQWGQSLIALDTPYGWPAAAGAIVAVLMVCWTVGRTHSNRSEFTGPSAGFFAKALIVVALTGALAFQNWLLNAMLSPAGRHPTLHIFADSFKTAILGSPALAVVIAFFRNQLTDFAKSQGSLVKDFLSRHASRLLLAFGALLLPFTLWLIYLRLVFWGLRNTQATYQVCIVVLPCNSPQAAAFYLIVAAVLLVVCSLLIGPNSYSLHRLYRDRLDQGFIRMPWYKTAKSPKVSELTTIEHPFPIFNTALNIQNSTVNQRGRNADFFSFTPLHSGSPSTGYVKTKALQKADKALDLPTVVAISGAAAAANMGVNSRRPMAFTLAALNIRLGYWLSNPANLAKGGIRLRSKINGDYLWNEMTSSLDETKDNVLLTDGGHVENLGIYELLRRRCKLIIAIDAEADGDMTFGSLYQLERFARIDLGVRITIDVSPIAKATRPIMKANAEGKDLPAGSDGPHAALGLIHYDGDGVNKGETGYLLYFKSSLCGSEPDYVCDYARKNPTFPHESTADLFYSEEQFEAYRALGFHMVQRALASLEDVVLPGKKGTSYLGTLGSGSAVPAEVVRILSL